MIFKETEIGLIPEDWEIKKLGDISDIIMGQSPSSEYYNFNKDGLPFFQGNKDFGYKYPNVSTWCSDSKKIAGKNSVLISLRAPLGEVNMSLEKCCIGRGLASLNIRNGNNEFLYYSLKFNNERIKQNFDSEGTVFGCITKEGINNFNIIVPKSYTEQQKIASILSSLDNKIELNNQINQTLEKIAQAIFKHWFIDFEFPNEEGKPYKSSNGEIVNSELGNIPKGWRIGNLSNEFKITMGQSPPGESYNENGNGTIFFQGRSDFGFRFPTNRIFCTDPKRYANKFDTLVSVRAPVGDMNMALENCCIGRGLASVIHNNKYFSYTYYKLLSLTEEFRNFEAEGTVFGSINKNNFENIKNVIPSEELIKEFERLVNPIDELIYNNTINNYTLSQLRDSLLPKLMSGKIRVQL